MEISASTGCMICEFRKREIERRYGVDAGMKRYRYRVFK
jgi:hypothetical protein